ncbi:MAG TPA: CRISPR-associated endonuclease Cas2 [Ktedonobacteraceae bacterium]|nr:CRISPR-associated endonuclease Cas2 [Ktedonobacteraceae bacterium]
MSQTGNNVRGVRQSTLYVVAYDIQDDKRRTKVHKVLKGFGEWTEFSLFECFLTKKELLQMRAKLDTHLDARTDRVRIYMICDVCLTKVETVGISEPVEQSSYIL